MKRKISLLLCALIVLAAPCFAQETESGLPTPWLTVIGYAVAGYEILARLVPTVGDITILGKIFKFLGWVSDKSNNLKK